MDISSIPDDIQDILYITKTCVAIALRLWNDVCREPKGGTVNGRHIFRAA
jgi:hypothetical protein